MNNAHYIVYSNLIDQLKPTHEVRPTIKLHTKAEKDLTISNDLAGWERRKVLMW